jgi:hypothetical protein
MILTYIRTLKSGIKQVTNMEIFISWSGDLSKKIAEQLKIFLPSVIQSLKPFYSSEDISKGKRWNK